MYPEIGYSDAKSKLPELLREVRDGRRYTITLKGKPIADLVPAGRAGEDEVREAIAAMQAMSKIKGVSAADQENWIAESRK